MERGMSAYPLRSLACFGGTVAKGLAQIGFTGDAIAKATQEIIKRL
jgi:hypothetical protein